MKTKVLYCDGDSWTAGDIVDPKLFGDNVKFIIMIMNNIDYQEFGPQTW